MSDRRACDCADTLALSLGAPVLMSFGDLILECPWCGAYDVDPEQADVRTAAAAPRLG